MLSVIIPTKNEEKYLPKLLCSIKAQGIQDYEVIVADADSTDKTIEIAKDYGCKIIRGGMPATGRNQGAKYSKGDILVFIDADTMLPNNFFKYALREIETKNLDLVGTSYYPVPSQSKLKNFKYFIIYNIENKVTRLTKETKNPQLPGCCVFVKKEIHDMIRGFDESLIWGEDSDYAKKARGFGIRLKILDQQKIFVSTRRFEKEGWRIIAKCLILIILRAFGHKFKEGKTKFNYFKDD
jgi:glycosyltransferase involved in cell wall biosynthesis